MIQKMDEMLQKIKLVNLTSNLSVDCLISKLKEGINFRTYHNHVYLSYKTSQPASLVCINCCTLHTNKTSTKILICQNTQIAYPELHQEKHLLRSFVIQFFEASLLFWEFVINLSDINCLKLVLEENVTSVHVQSTHKRYQQLSISNAVLRKQTISQFQKLALTFKKRPCENEFYLQENKKLFS